MSPEMKPNCLASRHLETFSDFAIKGRTLFFKHIICLLSSLSDHTLPFSVVIAFDELTTKQAKFTPADTQRFKQPLTTV